MLLWASSLMTYLSYIVVYAGILYSAIPLTSVLNFACSSSQPSLVSLTWGCTTSASPALCLFQVLLSIYMLFMSLKCLKMPVLFLFSMTSLPLTSCYSFFHDYLPPIPIWCFLLLPQFDLVLLLSPRAVFQAFTWLQLLLCADDSEMHSAPLMVCHRPSSSRLPPCLFLFGFSIRSHSSPKPWMVLPKFSLSLSFKMLPAWWVASSQSRRDCFLINLVYFMRLDHMQILRALYC